LSTDARTAIPHDVQQLVVIDYRAMQNSTAAMNLRDRVMPAELKPFDEALRKSGLNDNHDVEQLAFVLFRPKAPATSWRLLASRKASSPFRTSWQLPQTEIEANPCPYQQGLSPGQDRHGCLLCRSFHDGLRNSGCSEGRPLMPATALRPAC
jgi:hypothetical protein